VTYYAPSTPGTFQVSAAWCICFTPAIIKQGMSSSLLVLSSLTNLDQVLKFVIVGKCHFITKRRRGNSILGFKTTIQENSHETQHRTNNACDRFRRGDLAAMAVSAIAQSFPGAGTVMTYNVNEGTDFQQVVGATTLPQFLIGVGEILTQVQGTNPPERMQAVAKKSSKHSRSC